MWLWHRSSMTSNILKEFIQRDKEINYSDYWRRIWKTIPPRWRININNDTGGSTRNQRTHWVRNEENFEQLCRIGWIWLERRKWGIGKVPLIVTEIKSINKWLMNGWSKQFRFPLGHLHENIVEPVSRFIDGYKEDLAKEISQHPNETRGIW